MITRQSRKKGKAEQIHSDLSQNSYRDELLLIDTVVVVVVVVDFEAWWGKHRNERNQKGSRYVFPLVELRVMIAFSHLLTT